MHQLKFFKLLGALEKEGQVAFRNYLRRVRAKDRVARNLFDEILKQQAGTSQDAAPGSPKLAGRPAKGTPKNTLNSFHDLCRWLKEFLLFEKATDGKLDSQLMWLHILEAHRHKLETEFLSQVEAVRQEVEQLKANSVADLLKNLAVKQFIEDHHQWQQSAKQSAQQIGALRRQNGDLDLAYAVAKLKMACQWANLKNMGSVQDELDTPVPLPELSNHPALAGHPLAVLYREVYALITGRQEEQYQHISALLNRYAPDIDRTEILLMLRYLNNYVSIQIRNGKETYMVSAHLLNKFSLEHQMAPLTGGAWTAPMFNNMVAAACFAHDVDWARAFVTVNSSFLPETVREDAVMLAWATIDFEKREFERVRDTLLQLDFKDIQDNIRSKALTLKCLYEIGRNENFALDFCASLERYLRRQQHLQLALVGATLNVVKIVKMLLGRKATKAQLYKTIETTKPLYFKTWLLEKAARYSGKR